MLNVNNYFTVDNENAHTQPNSKQILIIKVNLYISPSLTVTESLQIFIIYKNPRNPSKQVSPPLFFGHFSKIIQVLHTPEIRVVRNYCLQLLIHSRIVNCNNCGIAHFVTQKNTMGSKKLSRRCCIETSVKQAPIVKL